MSDSSPDWRRSSLAVASVQRIEQTLESAYGRSRLALLLAGVPTAIAGSRTVSSSRTATHTAARWLASSAVYRWLTAEPDPEVIVVDLRETYTVGPFVAAVDRAADAYRASATRRVVSRATDGARDAPLRQFGVALLVAALVYALAAPTPSVAATGAMLLLSLLCTRVRADADALAQARTMRLLRALLEPPAPPEKRTNDEATPDDRANDQRTTDDHATDDRP